jgi:hypothetical protein
MPRSLSDDDLIEVLEEIIKDSSNAAARIAAIRALRELERDETPQGAFADLYRLAPRIRTKTRSGTGK